MKTVYVHFSNHFDLVWRRCWDREYDYEGGRYASYRRIEALCLEENLALAEAGEGAYCVEQALTMRAFLETHPQALPRLRVLHDQGLFEIHGAGEAIIDINLCSGETLCRNLASGVRYCRDILGMPPVLANHGDGFGSSAQFPQVLRQCGFRGIQGLSYATPAGQYWRGVDGSTVLFWKGAPGRRYFFDHCYHEPCRVCGNRNGTGCSACAGTGVDLPQNFYPPFEPVADDAFQEDRAEYQVCSEEMLPPKGFNQLFRRWETATPQVRYRWGTPRLLAGLWEPLARAVDSAPEAEVSPCVENNPVHSGCLVSRIRIKQMARRLESCYYGWEKALALTRFARKRLERRRWQDLFLEIPLAFFHDAVTGTHQDEAARELQARMADCMAGVRTEGLYALGVAAAAKPETRQGATAVFFSPQAAPLACRADLPEVDGRSAPFLVAVDEAGRRHPVVLPWHSSSPALPLAKGRLINSVGPDARTRPPMAVPRIELRAPAPLAWGSVRLEESPPPRPLEGRVLRNEFFTIRLDDHGVGEIRHRRSGLTAGDGEQTLGEVLLEEDEGDPWGTRKTPAFSVSLRPYTQFLGALQFDGYQEAYYGGHFEPNLRFGRELDGKIFALDWYVTLRLLDDLERVDFSHELFWKSSDRRLRVAFPVQAPADEGYYSIPAGWLRRKRYEKTESHLWSPNGDWPALHFVAAPPPTPDGGWAVVNYGTPSARIAEGTIFVSLVRSPGSAHCLQRYGQAYPMPTDGIRDGGWHHFETSLLPYGGEADLPGLALRSAALNQAAPCFPLPDDTGPETVAESLGLCLEGEGVELLAAKPCFDDSKNEALVLRLVNHAPGERSVRLRFPRGDVDLVSRCNLLEDVEEGLTVADDAVQLTLSGFEICSLLVSPRHARGVDDGAP